MDAPGRRHGQSGGSDWDAAARIRSSPRPRGAGSLVFEGMEELRGQPPILVGTCNWVDHEEFYPDELRGRRQRERLAFYARYFPLVEIDSSFYGIPTPDRVADWVARTPDDFLFNIKAYRSLTGHEREQGRPRPPTDDEERAFLEALAPLRQSGKLGAIHYQYPPWVVSGPAGREALLRRRARPPGDVIAVGFRPRPWFEGERLAETEDLLRELDCTLVGVDAPQLGSGTAPPHLAVTSHRLGVARPPAGERDRPAPSGRPLRPAGPGALPRPQPRDLVPEGGDDRRALRLP